MADISAIAVVAGIILGLIPSLRWALSTPLSSPREIAGYILLTAAGVIYLLVMGINPLAPDGTGVLAYIGAGGVGTLLIDAAARTSASLPSTSPST